MLKTPKTEQSYGTLKSQIEALEEKNRTLEHTIKSECQALLHKLPFYPNDDEAELDDEQHDAPSHANESNDDAHQHEMSFTAAMSYHITKIIIKEVETFLIERYHSYFDKEDKGA